MKDSLHKSAWLLSSWGKKSTTLMSSTFENFLRKLTWIGNPLQLGAQAQREAKIWNREFCERIHRQPQPSSDIKHTNQSTFSDIVF
jgi:hypothetical protein